jgi:hypothetical protein
MTAVVESRPAAAARAGLPRGGLNGAVQPKRRWSLLVGGLLLVLLCAGVFAVVQLGGDARVQVLAIGRWPPGSRSAVQTCESSGSSPIPACRWSAQPRRSRSSAATRPFRCWPARCSRSHNWARPAGRMPGKPSLLLPSNPVGYQLASRRAATPLWCWWRRMTVRVPRIPLQRGYRSRPRWSRSCPAPMAPAPPWCRCCWPATTRRSWPAPARSYP